MGLFPMNVGGKNEEITALSRIAYYDLDPNERKTTTVENGALYVIGVHNPTQGDFLNVVSGGTLIKSPTGYDGVAGAYLVRATSTSLVISSRASSGKIYTWVGKVS